MQPKMDRAFGERLFSLREQIIANFESPNWEEIGLLTGCADIIDGHSRLLRSLYWHDEDYSGNVLNVLKSMSTRDISSLDIISDYISRKFPGESHYISSKPSERRITFAPSVFSIPDSIPEPDLVAVMMPFSPGLRSVFEAIKLACDGQNLRCLRADDIWEDSTIIQDIFSLIYKSKVVIVDFSGKNPNVMYETGIAHTLGKHVIPISQSIDDVPFDMKHHRVLKYLPNKEGLSELTSSLYSKLAQFAPETIDIDF